MSNQPSGACPYCGTPLVASQRFCSNCGATAVENNQKTGMSSEYTNTYTPAASTPNIYPAPPQTYVDPIPYAQEYQPTAGNYQTPVPDYAKPQDASRSVLKQIGCGIVVMLLLIFGLCIGGSILAVHWISTLPADTTPAESSPENYMPSSTSAYSQTQDAIHISRIRVSSIDTSEVIYIQINPSA